MKLHENINLIIKYGRKKSFPFHKATHTDCALVTVNGKYPVTKQYIPLERNKHTSYMKYSGTI